MIATISPHAILFSPHSIHVYFTHTMTVNNPFLQVDTDELISKLSLDEKVSLLGAPNWWNTNKIERLGVPSVRMSDGPNGVRGSSHFLSSPAQCIPVSLDIRVHLHM